jgi:hypothetical protein
MKQELMEFCSQSTLPNVSGAARIHQVGPYHPLVTHIPTFHITREILRAKYSQSKHELLAVVGDNG